MSDLTIRTRSKHTLGTGSTGRGRFGYYYFYFAGHRAGLSVPSAGVSR